MRTVMVVFVAALALVAAQAAQAFEPNWGEAVDIKTSQLKYFYEPAWSPDGEILAFTSSPQGIWSVEVDGGAPSPVYAPVYSLTDDPWFTPDGMELYFSCLLATPGVTGDRGIMSVDLESGDTHEIVPGQFPVISPSGRYLCHTTRRVLDDPAGDHLVILDIVTGKETTLVSIPPAQTTGTPPVTSGPLLLGRASFMPDEKSVVYSLSPGSSEGTIKLFRIPITGGEPQEIVVKDKSGNLYECISPCVHPDGIHAVVRGEHMNLAWVNLDTGLAIPLTGIQEVVSDIPTVMGSSPVISPDGTRVCFTYTDATMMDGNRILRNELHIIELGDLVSIVPMSVASAPAPYPTLVNYPNPFNPSTTLSFTLPESGFTELSIYNLAGQKIRTLVAGDMAEGTHEALWDGKNDRGVMVSSGIYFSHLKAGEQVITGRMMLVK